MSARTVQERSMWAAWVLWAVATLLVAIYVRGEMQREELLALEGAYEEWRRECALGIGSEHFSPFGPRCGEEKR